MSATDKPIAITCGDPAGVGPEVIAAALAEVEGAEAFCLLGAGAWGRELADRFGCAHEALGKADFSAKPGEPSAAGAWLALEALERAADGCKRGDFAAVVTGPVSKSELAKVGYRFPGQTEFFGEHWAGTPVMAFAGSRILVSLVSWHIPLSAVPSAITQESLERAVQAAARLAEAKGCKEPRVGVCGLNPHAGEGGLLGSEELERIDPWLDQLRADWPGLSRTQPADTLFYRHLEGEFDSLVALYHDQALAPVKTLDFHGSVNITLGLEHVRTSPDHGTAFALAGRGEAQSRSMTEAIAWARRLA